MLAEEITWSSNCPDTPFHRAEQFKLAQLVHDYIEHWNSGTFLAPLDTRTFCESARVWTVELLLTMIELHRRRAIPKFLWLLHDKHIRGPAAAHETFVDPGNFCLDVAVHALKLWDFVCPQRREQIMRTAPGQYGTGRNKSAAGPVNLRGNVYEALVTFAQELGTKGQ